MNGGVLKELLTQGAPTLAQSLGGIAEYMGQALGGLFATPAEAREKTPEEKESELWGMLKTYQPVTGRTLAQYNRLFQDYEGFRTQEERNIYWQQQIGKYSAIERTILNRIKEIRDELFPAPGYKPEDVYTADELEQIANVVAGGPQGLLELWQYPNPIEKAKKQLPGLYARNPKVFEKYVEQQLNLLSGGRVPSALPPEQLAVGELKEIPSSWREVFGLAEEARGELYYRPREEVLAEVSPELLTERQQTVFDYLISQPMIHPRFKSLSGDFLATIGVDRDTGKVTEPILAPPLAKEARRLLIVAPEEPPRSQWEIGRVAMFLYGPKALTPKLGDVIYKDMLERAERQSMTLPETALREEIASAALGVTPEVMKAAFAEPNIGKPIEEQVRNVLVLYHSGIINDQTAAHLLRLIGNPAARGDFNALAEQVGVLKKGEGAKKNLIDRMHELLKDLTMTEGRLKRILLGEGYTEDEINNAIKELSR